MLKKYLKSILLTVLVCLFVGVFSVSATWPEVPGGSVIGGWLGTIFDLDASGSGELVVKGNVVANNPTDNQHLTTKEYVDQKVAAANGGDTFSGAIFAGTFFENGGENSYCRKMVVNSSGQVSRTNINEGAVCDGQYATCNSGKCYEIQVPPVLKSTDTIKIYAATNNPFSASVQGYFSATNGDPITEYSMTGVPSGCSFSTTAGNLSCSGLSASTYTTRSKAKDDDGWTTSEKVMYIGVCSSCYASYTLKIIQEANPNGSYIYRPECCNSNYVVTNCSEVGLNVYGNMVWQCTVTH